MAWPWLALGLALGWPLAWPLAGPVQTGSGSNQFRFRPVPVQTSSGSDRFGSSDSGSIRSHPVNSPVQESIQPRDGRRLFAGMCCGKSWFLSTVMALKLKVGPTNKNSIKNWSDENDKHRTYWKQMLIV